MSQLQHSLKILGFDDIQDVTAEALKKSFKVTVLRVHPDKGGNQEEFDHFFCAYLYLLETVSRIHGGRESLSGIISPDELKESRIDEMVNRMFEEKMFQEFEREKFNIEFEKHHPREDHGYKDWLQEGKYDENVTDGEYGSATQLPPTFEEHRLHEEFEKQAKDGKPEPTAIILHPEDMAYYSGNIMGTAIIESNTGCYTSDPFVTPEYTDVYAAFTKENTICDKVSSFIEINKTLEELIKERNMEITPLQDKELEAIASFEKKKLQQDQEHFDKVKDYFENGGIGNIGGSLTNWPPTNYPKENYKGFVLEL